MAKRMRSRRSTRGMLLGVLLVTLVSARSSIAQMARNGTRVDAMMRNVDFHIDQTIILRIGYLRGQLMPTRPGAPAILDDPTSFVLEMDTALVRVSARAMAELLNRYAFGYRGAPLRGLKVEIEGARLRQRGRLNGMPFNILSEVQVTPAGEIRLTPVTIKAFGIPVKGIMRFFGMRLQKMMNVSKAKGIRVEGNDLIISPLDIPPSPRLQGHLTRIELADSTMLQVFRPEHGTAPAPLVPPDSTVRNYMYFQGGSLRFGLLTMTPADLLVEDGDPRDPFDFFLARYVDQLVDGFSRTARNGGLHTVLPDFGKKLPPGRKP